MFRKSVSFFILVALFWVLLWVYVPDASPGTFSLSDLFRGLFLLFSFLASGFALLMLVIRYKGVDIATSMIPHSGVVLWLGKHAYRYSQPKVSLRYLSGENISEIFFELNTETKSYVLCASDNLQEIDLGVVSANPEVVWQSSAGEDMSVPLDLLSELKRFGRNVMFELVVFDQKCTIKKLR